MAKQNINLAEDIKKEERQKIAQEICQQYRIDILGRKDWEEKREKYYKLWLCKRDPKNTPFPNAANICIPMLAVACNQFHSRAYQAFTSPPQWVKGMPVEENDVKNATVVEQYMNWQLMYDMDTFESEMDKLLLYVPINGTGFKKLFYDAKNERPVSEYVSAMDVILPYRTRSIETARRIIHRVWLHYDELKLRAEKDKDFYIDFDKITEGSGAYEEGSNPMQQVKDDVGTSTANTEEHPKLILECHKIYPLKKGIYQPYIFTVDYESETLLRVTSRLLKIGNKEQTLNHFIDYHFIPNPEGYYSLGFGHFLEVLNEMANTAFNQIFDSGRLSNQPFGFYGRRAGVKKRELKLWPGRMEEVEDASQIYFPNMQRVDQTLFQILGLIQQYAEQFTSLSDYLLGRESRGTKTPTASGTLAIIEQGLILYSVMIKRLFTSFKKELRLIYLLNQFNLPKEKQYRVLGQDNRLAFPKIKRVDFDGHVDIIPIGDPSYASRLTRRQEAQEVYSMLLANPLIGASNPNIQIQNPQAILEATKDLLETYDKKDIQKFLPKLPEPMMSPEAENALFIQGDPHEPQTGEDHKNHLTVHLNFRRTSYYELMSEEKKELLKKHINKTVALMYQEQSLQGALGNPNMAGMSSQPMSAGITPSDLMPSPEQNATSPVPTAMFPAGDINGMGPAMPPEGGMEGGMGNGMGGGMNG